MANRNYTSNRVYSMHGMVVSIDCRISIGASGAPTLTANNSSQIQSVTRLAAGVYSIQFADNFNRMLNVQALLESPTAGSSVAGGAFSIGTVYQITSLGNTTAAQFYAAGLPSNLTPAVGQVFKAATVGAGTATVMALGNSGIAAVECAGVTSTMLNPAPQVGIGGYIVIQTLAATSASVTTLIPADPANGSVMKISFSMLNSTT